MAMSSSVMDGHFLPCFAEIQNDRLKLFSPNFSLPTSDRDMSLQEWVKSLVHWHTYVEAAAHALASNSLKFLVDGSFFPES